jgi:1,4-dihydroxy-2-naphthoate octaprenyltransferase
MSRLQRWLLAIRPKTLGISVAPVLAGSSLAWGETGVLLWPVALAALAAALLIQIGTNLHNDAADFERGTDTPARLGPERATAQGWFTAAEVKRAAHLCFGLAFLIGIYLAQVGGWPIVAIGLLSLAAGYAYTGGPRPIAYSAAGELFVFLFFGLAAVLGSYYLQTQRFSLAAFLAACAVGSLAAAVLLVNNYRDLDTDERTRKLTLTHYLGRNRSKVLYGLLLLAPFLLPLALGEAGPWLVVLLLPGVAILLRQFISQPPGPRFNRILANTAKLELAYGVLLSIGVLIKF